MSSLPCAILSALGSRLSTLSIGDIVAYTVKQTLKQLSHDNKDVLVYSDLKVLYLSDSSSSEDGDVPPPSKPKSKVVKIEEAVPEVKAVSKPKVDLSVPPKSYSKMKKDELLGICDGLGLDRDGTVPQLRARIKGYYEGAPSVPAAPSVPGTPAPAPPSVPAAAPTDKKKGKKKKVEKPVHGHALSEEAVEGCGVCETYGTGIAKSDGGDDDDDDYSDDSGGLSLGDRLKKLLASHGGDADPDDPDYVTEEEEEEEE